MRTTIKILIGIILPFLISTQLHATKRYWVGTTSTSWKNKMNWAFSSGGTGGPLGITIPGSGDTAFFDGSGNVNCSIDSTVSLKRLDISSGYSSTVTQSGSNTITIGTSGATLSGGIFTGGSANITVSGPFVISGCAFTSTSGTFSCSANFTVSSGSFTHNSGTVALTATSTLTISRTGGVTFYNLSLAPTAADATYTITSTTTITVSHLLSYDGTKKITLSSGTINATGNVTVNNTVVNATPGSATILISGTTKQTLTGSGTDGSSRLPNVTINKSDTLVLASIITIGGNWTYTAGVLRTAGSVIDFYGTKTISGKQTLAGVIFSGSAASTYTFTASDTLTVTDSIQIAGGTNAMTFNTCVICAKGNIRLSNTCTAGGGGSGKVIINGTTKQYIYGSTAFRGGEFPELIINKSDSLVLSGIITVKNDYTYLAGVISPGTSTLYFDGTSKRITGSHTLADVKFYGGNPSTYTIAPGTILTVTGTLSSNGGSAIKLDSGTVYVKGAISWANLGLNGGGSATIVINGNGAQSLAGSGTLAEGILPNININNTTGTLTITNVTSVGGDWTYSSGSVSAGTSTIALYGATKNLSGSSGGAQMQFNNVTVAAGSRTLTGNIRINGNLSISSGATLAGSSYSINLGGNWTNNGTWTVGTSTVSFQGSGFKTISKASGTETFYNATVNRSSGSLKLNNPVQVTHALTLTKGHVKSDTTNYLELLDNVTLTGGSDSAYVYGAVRKTGNDAFTFPLGDTTLNDTAYHPLTMTAPSSTGDKFQAMYKALGQTLGDSLVDSLAGISNKEYWSFWRKAGSSNVTVTLGWNRNSSNVEDLNTLRIANWNGVKWLDLGGTNITATGYLGTVSASVIPFYLPSLGVAQLTIAIQRSSTPYALLKKKLDGGYYQVINGRLYFRFDEEYNDADNKLSFKIYNDQHLLLTSDALATAPIQSVQYGDNRFKLNTLDCGISPTGILPDGVYILEVTNEKNEKWVLRFKQTTTFMIVNCYVPPASR